MPQADSSKSIYLVLYKQILYLYTVVRNFPKEYKYTLGQDILNLIWKTLDYVIHANTLPNNGKYKAIQKAMTIFDSLRYRLRLASDLKILDHKKYSFLIKQNTKIAKMLRGWFAWSKKI